MASGLSSQDHGEGVILDLKQMNMAPDPVIQKLGHNFVTLKWSLIKDQRRIGYIFISRKHSLFLAGRFQASLW